MTEFQQSHGESLVDEELLLMDKQRKWFFEMKSTPGEDAVKTVDMKTKYLDNYINLVDKAAAELERIDSNFKRSGEGNGNPVQYSCLESLMDRGVGWATVHGVTESNVTEHICTKFTELTDSYHK